jgi:tetratricopeptide (TPR) repeat protein
MVHISDITTVDADSARLGEQHRLAGNASFKAGDFEAAVRSYRLSLEAAPPPSPSAAAALGNRARALLNLGRNREALADAELCVRMCPSGTPYAAKSRFRKGEALEATGDLERARVAYRDANKEAPRDESVRRNIQRVSEAILMNDKYTRALGLSRQGRHEEALSDAREAVARDPEDFRSRYQLGEVALAAAEAKRAEALRLENENEPEKNREGFDRAKAARDEAKRFAMEARNDGFGYAMVQLDRTNDPSLHEGYEKCHRFLKDAEKIEQTFAFRPEPKKSVSSKVRSSETLETRRPEPNTVATVRLSTLVEYARREIRAKAAAETRNESDEAEAKEKRPSDADADVDAAINEFRDSVRRFGCAIVRLPDSLFEEDDVFGDAVSAASAFFESAPEAKRRSFPNVRRIPHGYLRPEEETRVDSVVSRNDARVTPGARRDETRQERFAVCDVYDSEFQWPSAAFKERALNAHVALRGVSRIVGDVFLLERSEIPGDEAYELVIDSLAESPDAQRTTFALHRERPSEDGDGKKKIRNADGNDGDHRGALSEARRALSSIVTAGEAEPEPTLLSLFPRARRAKTPLANTSETTRTPVVIVRCEGEVTTFSSSSSASASGSASGSAAGSASAANENENEKNASSLGSDGDRDVLVVAGTRLRDVLGATYVSPTVSFDGGGEEGPCVRIVHRA